MKRIVKVKFIDYWPGFFEKELEDYLILKILRKHYEVKICNGDEEADYVFFSAFSETHWNVPDKCIKIFHTGENVVPDFNACDYGIGFEWMDYEDRYIRFPLYLFRPQTILEAMQLKHIIPEGWNLKKEKPNFCSFVVSNGLNEVRNQAYQKLTSFKHVDSGGRYLNNIGGPIEDKLAFDSTHRFSLCYENGSHNGYTTEKLIEAFAARTIPIYWGDPKVGKIFNTKAMINVADFEDFDAVIKQIDELENNEQQYMEMLRQPALLPTAPGIEEEIERFEKWLINIFEQPLDNAQRRNRDLRGQWYLEKRKNMDIYQKGLYAILKERLKKRTERLILGK